ncbi:ribosome-binding factor A [Patescibacteria group bacterium]|nr:ribosome-binding factor A [Patescibacteria group bacterium]MCL5114613.1 ribosome-binding factor A [Patescibacteria group bacterium]
MRPYRNLKVGSVIQGELNKIFQSDFDFGGALATITSVEVAEDMSAARVKVSVLPFEKEIEVYKIIEGRRREIQGRLLRKMNIKPMPKLEFSIDQAK